MAKHSRIFYIVIVVKPLFSTIFVFQLYGSVARINLVGTMKLGGSPPLGWWYIVRSIIHDE